MAKVKPDTMDLCDQKEMLDAHPEWKANWNKWKNHHISAKDAHTIVDIVVCGIGDNGRLIAKLKYAKNETNCPKGWLGVALGEESFILSNYKDVAAHYTYDFKLD